MSSKKRAGVRGRPRIRSQAERRVQHKQISQEARRKEKERLEQLQLILPAITTGKCNKVSVLKSTLSTLKELKSRCEYMESAVDSLEMKIHTKENELKLAGIRIPLPRPRMTSSPPVGMSALTPRGMTATILPPTPPVHHQLTVSPIPVTHLSTVPLRPPTHSQLPAISSLPPLPPLPDSSTSSPSTQPSPSSSPSVSPPTTRAVGDSQLAPLLVASFSHPSRNPPLNSTRRTSFVGTPSISEYNHFNNNSYITAIDFHDNNSSSSDDNDTTSSDHRYSVLQHPSQLPVLLSFHSPSIPQLPPFHPTRISK